MKRLKGFFSVYIIMAYKNREDRIENQRIYRLNHKEYFTAYRSNKGTYFVDKKREWAKLHPGKATEYVKKYQLWKKAVKQLFSIDVMNL